ncbi:tRNA lysidine(34) synthetase TilS [Nocardioides sp.]|uniref:tRNA lysidine(34) synthetase TilS n=1 Tax=Nocardioides sp. TaxID=35761 RepID=UPI002ED55468
MSLDPALAAVRGSVRRALTDVGDQPVLVACSGGADSLALLAAAVFEARERPCRIVGVTVDHGVQAGSAERADAVIAQMVTIGVDETVAVRVTVEASGQGPEAAAREARYAVLEEVAERFAAAAVLLGHTLDDQAETVLLGLTRGSGGRSLAGMRPAFDRFRRPLLGITRAQTEAVCRAEGLEWWTDPHNSDPAYTRARIRTEVMPMLERELGPGVAETLARTASQLRADVELLDAQAAAAYDELVVDHELPAGRLGTLPDALRLRVLRLGALRAGAIPSDLTHGHLLATDDLVCRWRGQVGVDLPGRLRAVRREGRLAFVPSDRPS